MRGTRRVGPSPLLDLLVLSDDERAEAAAGLESVAAGAGVGAAELTGAFMEALRGL